MDPFIGLVLIFVVWAAYGLGRLRSRPEARTGAPKPGPSEVPIVGPQPAVPVARSLDEKAKVAELYSIAAELEPTVNQAARVLDVVEDPVFQRGVNFLSSHAWSNEELIAYFRGESVICACLALEALARRVQADDGARAVVSSTILDSLNDYVTWNRYFALRTLDAIHPAPASIAGQVLSRLDDSWLWNPSNLRVLDEFLQRRIREGESLDLAADFEAVPGGLDEERLDNIESILKKLPSELGRPLVQQLVSWKGRRIDRTFLSAIGRLGPAKSRDGQARIIEHDAERAGVQKLEATLLDGTGRSVILVGEHGVGKTTLVHGLAERLVDRDYLLFEASAVEVLAGQSYLGQLEERIRNLLARLRGRPVVWFIPDFHMLRLAGQHRHSSTGLLDMLLPAIESGAIVVVGETTPTAYEQLVLAKPRVRTAFEALRVQPLAENSTRDLVRLWAADRVGGDEGLSVQTRDEAFALAQQYLADLAAPGNVLKLLDDTRARILATNPDSPVRIGTDDLITTLSQMTGLPASVLDERQGLDLEGLRGFFRARVKGQPEAVDCIVDRIAMIKAGVTDPSRPFGVFLFAGPTGTGKTEIAKTLAEYLFGSESRLLRLDMSELQTPESLDRLIGSTDKDQRGGALVDLIRKQPFSVILLDEFEKAHPNVWDLFLQLFDDGRLTDREGSTADFRNAIVILTSNLGGNMRAGAGLGFTDETGHFSESAVTRAVEASFRKEFLNRLDRVVVFRPLSRDVMGEILRKELAAAFQRRGLRNREWAVEWDATALEFLLERGFTVDLGARPLRRAIERFLLSPLSQTIVNHQYPEGDQFLFVRADHDRLVVEFVDPDAEDEVGVEAGTFDETGDASLEQVGLDPRGTGEELTLLRRVHDELSRATDVEDWQSIKRDGLARMQEPGFWDASDRFVTLGDIEYIDRLESGLQAAGSVLERLSGKRGGPSQVAHPKKLLGRVASRLFLLRAAIQGVLEMEPREAFISIEPWSDGHEHSKKATEFAHRVEAMYGSWAKKRGMAMERLDTGLFAVSGYASFSLLKPERGLHIWEIARPERRPQRATVRVRVAPQSAIPVGRKEQVPAEARKALAADKETPAIVRHYQEMPSPLVRDSASGWRSGRLDRVLAGEFDLLGCVRRRVREGERSPETD